MFKLSLLSTLLYTSASIAQAAIIPSEFTHNRVFVTAKTPDNTHIKLYTDTGGGFNAISQSLVSQYKLEQTGKMPDEAGGMPLVDFPKFILSSGIPSAPKDPWLQGKLVPAPEGRIEHDGFLGSRWFDKGIWKFDYVGQSLEKLTSFSVDPSYTSIGLGFKRDTASDSRFAFPRFEVEIDGKTIDMLLDTGASAKVSDDAANTLALPKGTIIGTSYITQSQYEQWREKHKDWPVINNAEVGTGKAFAMIQVPDVKIAGQSLGKVWFSVRPDKNFTEYMSQMMDKKVHGALGGSAFKNLTMVIDYPAQTFHFKTSSSSI